MPAANDSFSLPLGQFEAASTASYIGSIFKREFFPCNFNNFFCSLCSLNFLHQFVIHM